MVVRPQPFRPKQQIHQLREPSTTEYVSQQQQQQQQLQQLRNNKLFQSTQTPLRRLTPTSSTPSPNTSLAKYPPTPTSQLSEHSTDGSRSIPTVDVPTLVHLFIPDPEASSNKPLTSESIISEASNDEAADSDLRDSTASIPLQQTDQIKSIDCSKFHRNTSQEFDEYHYADTEEGDSFAAPTSAPILPRPSNLANNFMPSVSSSSLIQQNPSSSRASFTSNRDVQADPPKRNLKYLRAAAQSRHRSALETSKTSNSDLQSSDSSSNQLFHTSDNSNSHLYHPIPPFPPSRVRKSADSNIITAAISKSSSNLRNPPVTLHKYPHHRPVEDPTLSHRRQRRAASQVDNETNSTGALPRLDHRSRLRGVNAAQGSVNFVQTPKQQKTTSMKYRQRAGTDLDEKDQNHRRRRRSSYLTSAFTRRKNSALSVNSPEDSKDSSSSSSSNNDPTLQSQSKLARDKLYRNTKQSSSKTFTNEADSHIFYDHDVEPVHAYIPLVRFGESWTSDAVVLYTNSIRSELNDLIFLCGCMQRKWEKNGLAGPSDKTHNIEMDFETWFNRFAQYTELILLGFQEYFFPFITDLLSQRDVMMSRTTANVEASGTSYVEAWSVSTRELFLRMEEVRDLISQVENRVLRLHRRRLARENKARNDMWVATRHAVVELIPVMVDLTDQLNKKITEMLMLKADSRKSLRKVYKQFAMLITKEGAQILGWSAIVTMTKWINDRKTKSEHMAQLARASRQALFTRYRADNSHHSIVKIHQSLAMHEGRR